MYKLQISNSDSVFPVESVECLPKQPQGLNLLIMHNIREIELKGFDMVKSLFTLSIASSLMLEILSIEKCPRLEHIIDIDDEYDKENLKAIFPNLKEFSVCDCDQLKYILGQYHVANKDYKEIHIHFSTLEILSLSSLPNFVSICATNTLTVTWPSLKVFDCSGCFYPFYDSVSLLTIPTNSRQPNSKSMKVVFIFIIICYLFTFVFYLHFFTFSINALQDPEGIQKHFLTLQTLSVGNSKVEGIFYLNGHGMIGQQVSLRLEHLFLFNLPQMTCIWVTSKNSVTLQHLANLQINGCKKLKVIFPASVLRGLPELKQLIIRECKELKQIMEEDDRKLSNLLSTQPCFPKLAKLYIWECHKLKRLSSSSNDLPNLNLLTIDGASELEEIIGCKQGASMNSYTFPNLKRLEIIGCAKLKVIFPKSILRCLPELNLLKIRKCTELRQIIEEGDAEDKFSSNLSSQPCFPKLEALHIDQCNRLKRLFYGSASNDLPNLHLLIINGASELEELVGCEQGKHDDEIGKVKVQLPRLKLLMFIRLSSFRQEIESRNLKNRIIYECPKFSLTSTTTFVELHYNFPDEGKYYRVFKYKLLLEGCQTLA